MSSKTSSKMYLMIMLTFLIGMGRHANADFTFGTPINLGPTVNSISNDQAPSISTDSLSLYFSDHPGAPMPPGGYGQSDIWITTRQTKDDPWGAPDNLGPVVNSSAQDEHPSISADGLSLYFGSTRAGGSGSHDIWVTTRETKDGPWGNPVNLGSTVNSTYSEWCPNISADGLSLYFCDYLSPRPGGYGEWDIYVTTRSSVSDPWSIPVNLGPNVNSSGIDASPNISADGLTLFLNSNRSGGLGNSDLWMTWRKTRDADWEPSINLGPTVNESGFEASPNLSADGTTLYFGSQRPVGSGFVDLWQMSIEPIVDLNSDEIVDSADMCIMVDYWGTDEPLCDIGPMPWGDGIVDVQDLVVLAEHLLPVFPAHWEFDETEGSIAYDSVGDHDGTLNGNPFWQPADGKVNGALQLDGIDDYVSVPFVLDPAKRSLSTFVWIKANAPEQVVISQTNGIGAGWGGSWLYADSSGGRLATKFMDPNPELVSESVITDGTWHHIGLVWDRSYRYLYVDGVEVVKDVAALGFAVPCDGDMYLGVGKNLDSASFFSGLIDDVRIYNAALSAEEVAALAQ